MKTPTLAAKPFILLVIGLVAGCASTSQPEQSAYQLVEIDHGMNAQERQAYRLSQVEEMQIYVGEIIEGRNRDQPAAFRTETFDIVIENLGQVEHTVWLNRDQGIVYNWEVLGETSNGGLYFDHHGHPGKENRDQFPYGYFETFATGTAAQGHGIVNPGIDGYHGWFFINLEDRPVTVRVTMSGYWDRHLEIYRAVAGEVVTSVDY